MAHPTQQEMLTAAEALTLQEFLDNPMVQIAVRKVLAYDAKVHDETMRNEALAPDPNVNRIVQAAARSRNTFEWFETMKSRIKALTTQQIGR